ncbi:Hemerythrin HHE cation binding domain-containing protein [Nonomuraea solani]|uniref:Hemerythrin HHE cation binding domain-containing protein n=1 Tax=Nonomuraea solani TaxID=1144553 RepID=A0A1H5YY95_9ACTN|nr:LLM class flavin-dependent oxidoreductase [Nonomuraea solani]SEG29203.1 Hemerythrin HHE cation binding domain-containing protein [Nonomuraea solani]
MHDLWFGAFLSPEAAGRERLLRHVTLADRLGLDLVGVQDHPYQAGFLDTWTLLSAVAARTERIRLVPDVLNLPLRPPAVLAGAAASLDLLSGGRVELGLGAGAFWDAVAAMGGRRLSPPRSIEALAEAITIIRALWTPGEPVVFEGAHYRLGGARPGPFPAHPIGIWIGAIKRRMLELTGRMGDGWLASSFCSPPGAVAAQAGILDAAAADAGRDAAEIRKVYNIGGTFSPLPGPGFLDGPPALWAEQLTELVLDVGMTGFVLAPGPEAERDLRTFAQEVAPAVREAVAREHGGPAPAPAERPVTLADLDEEGRPSSPKRDPAALTPEQRRLGRHLVEVHDGYRREMRQVQDAVEQVASELPAIDRLTVRQNHWTLGTFCATFCRLLTVHHTVRNETMFPALLERDPALAPVIKKLEQEHEVIAELLTRLDEACLEMLRNPARIDLVRIRADRLADVLSSHFAYEEAELAEPIARLEVCVWLGDRLIG